MSDLILHSATVGNAVVLPSPRGGEISIRLATLAGGDVKFIDELQRKHARMVGWFPTKQIEGNIAKGKVLIAEEGQIAGGMPPAMCQRVGYVIASDKYLKREELGICYQLNVVPSKHRGLIGASLIKEVFNRAAYGCKLFCCWCAQDLQANYFWESLGFVPLAFRTGSRSSSGGAGSKKTPRIHIFWQRRIREGDTETPYWFPSETSGGAVKENRLVLPIPPGTSWQDAKPAILPGMENVNVLPPGEQDMAARKPREKKPKAAAQPKRVSCGLWFAPPKPAPGSPEAKAAKAAAKPKREKFRNDPKLVEAARELRDRYIEQINSGGAGMLLPPSANGKYDVSRQLEAAPSAMQIEKARLLEAA